VAAAWGAAEATLFFVVPDVWVGLAALAAPRRTLRVVLATVVGAVAGTVGLYMAGRHGCGATIDRAFERLPGVTVSDVALVQSELDSSGVAAFVRAPLRAVPLKLYTRQAQRAGWALPLVLAGATGNRLVRLIPVAAAFALLGHALRGRIEARPGVALTVYGVGWAAFYAWYWRR
jgi:hypothetical protein